MTEPNNIPTTGGAESRLWQRWNQGERVDLDAFLAGCPPLGPGELVALLLIDQGQRWERGERIPAESYLRRYPHLEADPEAVVEIVYAEFLLREARGERPALAEYALRFPAWQARLGQQVELHRALQGESTPEAGASTADGPPLPHRGPAGQAAAAPGRYRRLRPHARGGLGEVHVALDEELHREVALKEIQERFADEPDCRGRFLREAEITGRLEHPGVVPVYGLGAGGDGRPFYAMRFIRGESMDEAVRRFHQADQAGRRDAGARTLALRELLGRFVAVCNTVGYAHSRGVIHRDLKPANVMLGDYGETLVVDWGLARTSSQLESCLKGGPGAQASAEPPVGLGPAGDAAATEMGQVVGTAGFMPPEQATGRVDQVGPASDVFALGATLYCLITGQPPYTGADALLQAALAEPPPARQRNRSAPAALEAVCARAMAANPQHRYATAQALAQEVQRWLADEKVEAYPEPLPDRVRRWGRRNRTLASAGLILLVAGTAGLAVGLGAVERERERTKAALVRALDAEEEATSNLEQALEAEAREKAAARLARAQKERAQQAEADTLADYRAATDDAVEQLIGSKPRLGPQEKRYLERTLKRWQAFAGRAGDDERSREVRAEGLFRVAGLRAKLGQEAAAAAGYREALPLFQKLADEHPAVAAYRRELAATHASLATLLQPGPHGEESAAHYGEALRLLRGLADAFPAERDYRQTLALTANNFANLRKKQNRLAEAAGLYRQALLIQEKLADTFRDVAAYRTDLAATCSNLGNLGQTLNQLTPAGEHYRKALALEQDLARRYPEEPRYRQTLARTHNNLGNLLNLQNKDAAAADQYAQALAIQQKLVKEFPALPEYRSDLAATFNDQGHLLRRQNHCARAAGQYEEALALLQKLADEFRDAPEYRSELAGTHFHIGSLLADQGQGEKAAGHYQQALALKEKLAAALPGAPAHRKDLADLYTNLALLLADSNQAGKAAGLYKKALKLQQELADAFPDTPEYRQGLARTHKNWGVLLLKQHQGPGALEHYQQALALRQKLATEFQTLPSCRQELAASHQDMADLLKAQNQPAKSAGHYHKALDLRQKLADEFSDVPAYRKDLALTRLNLGILLSAVNQPDKAAAHLSAALDLLQRLADAFPTLPEYRQLLAGAHNSLGVLRVTQNQPAPAAKHHAAALALRQKLAREFPAVVGYRNDLGVSHNNLGQLLAAVNQADKAAGHYQAALAVFDKLAAEFPAVPEYRKYLAGTHLNLGSLWNDHHQPRRAAEQFALALAGLEKLAAEFPHQTEFRFYLAATRNNLGTLLQAQNQKEKAAEQFRKALDDVQKLADDFPAVTAYQVQLGGACCNYGMLLQGSSRPADSLPWLDKAVRVLKGVHEKNPRAATPRLFLRNSHWRRGQAYDTLAKHAEAVEDWAQAAALSPPPEQGYFRIRRADSRVRAGQVAPAAAELAELAKAAWPAVLWVDLARAYGAAASRAADKKEEYAGRAVDMLRKAVGAGFKDAARLAKDKDLEVLRDRADFKNLLGGLTAGVKDGKPAGR
jgi:serine/threonine-protein kinase